jgi:amidohydrolase
MERKRRRLRHALATALLAVAPAFPAFADDTTAQVRAGADRVEQQLIAWRHDLHRNPELSNREVRTARLVAEHLRALGFDAVHTAVAHTGVVGILKGGKPGPTVALRADMDALPVEERTGLPFASTARAEYNGQQVGVMHACGHDAHTAILMGVASVLAGMRQQIPGTVAFVFQPAEEGAPEGEEGGALLMLEQGLLRTAGSPGAIFGLHVWPYPAGQVAYRARGAMAASDGLRIVVKGRQTHGSSPWAGVDPVIVSAQIMTALQTIPSRQLDITRAPSVITIGSIHGGVRGNIIPDQVEMVGTVRTFDDGIRTELLMRLERTATSVAAAAGAQADVHVEPHAAVTWNDPDLTARMLPSLQKAADGNVVEGPLIMAAEDFSYYQREIPGLFVMLGVNMDGVSPEHAAPNHSPLFMVNDAALKTGVRTLAMLALDYLQQGS